ncbi:MAG TPA: hypothetical protein VMI54_16235 [Polyangiaceae bacterium]|nr:hypothetical protein [Polyangiaceae bacterium]
MASNLVRFGIPSIAVALGLLFVGAVARSARTAGLAPDARRREVSLAALGVAGFMGLLAALALSGLLGRFDLRPPPLALWMLATLGSAGAVAFSPLGRRLADTLPLTALVGFQVFRLPLELVMHEAAREKVMPSVMSFGGYNFDIVSGLTAAVVALLLARGRAPRGLVLAWNALGSLLLATIVTIAFLARPLVRAFGDAELNLWVTEFPYCWMAVMVSSALLGHLLVARKLARGRWLEPTRAASAA